MPPSDSDGFVDTVTRPAGDDSLSWRVTGSGGEPQPASCASHREDMGPLFTIVIRDPKGSRQGSLLKLLTKTLQLDNNYSTSYLAIY